MGNRRGWYIGGVLLAAVVATAAYASRQQLPAGSQSLRQESARAVTAVSAAPVQRGDIVQTLAYTGDVRAKAQVAVVPKVAGRIEKLLVDVGDKVAAGQPLALLEHDILDAQAEQAQAGLALAKARLASLLAGSRAETVAQAEANLRLAEARLAALNAGPAKAQIEAAEAGIRAAKNQLYAVQAQADAYLSMRGSGYTPDLKEAQAGAAYEQIKQAEAQLAALTAPPTKEQLDQAEAAVDAARQQLLMTQNPYTDNDLEAARAAVAQAEAGLKLATIQQKNAVVDSPASGIVSERMVSSGDMASPAAPMIVIMGEATEVQIGVEEAMVSQVASGKAVTVTVAAYPGAAMAGKVASVAPSLDPRTRTALVKIEVQDSQARLKPGMFAQASIITASRESVILVPKKAVVERNQRQMVFVASEGVAVMREVQTGLTDSKSIEVVSGLKNGELVILSGLADLADGDPVKPEVARP